MIWTPEPSLIQNFGIEYWLWLFALSILFAIAVYTIGHFVKVAWKKMWRE
jgi:hypothetical protein